MKRLSWLSILLCFILFQQVGAQPSIPNAKQLKAFGKEIRELSDILQLPGFCLAVVRNGQIIYQQNEGYANLEKKIPMTPAYMFQIASVTKTFTANLLMQYEQERKASVEDYALDYRFINTRFGYPYNIDVNAKIKHFLSHTSEDGPGRSFVYNGQRFNYIYGVFEKAGGHEPFTDAYSKEVQNKILDPLQMTHTITGFPDSRSDTMFKHIATPYIYDTLSKTFKEDTLNYRWKEAFPATGIISTIGDLVKYTNSYDSRQLVTAGSYLKMTSPQVLTDGCISPYGIGWFTEDFAGRQIHWHYGHADAYASLFVRVPDAGYTFIFLANSNTPSEALRLGTGYILQSPLVTAFFKTFIGGDPQVTTTLRREDSIARAYFLAYAATTYHKYSGEAKKYLREVYRTDPTRFDRYDPALIYLTTTLNTPELDSATERLITAFRHYGHIQPYVIADIARYYESRNEGEKAFAMHQWLANSTGFETWPQIAESCRKAGARLKAKGDMATARKYYWRAVQCLQTQYADENTIQLVIDEMNKR